MHYQEKFEMLSILAKDLLVATEKYAKATLTANNAANNFSDPIKEIYAAVQAGVNQSHAEKVLKDFLQDPETAVKSKNYFINKVNQIPSKIWWDGEGPVFNNLNGEDLILRKDVISILKGA